MSKIGNAIHEIESIDQMAKKDQWLNRIHPLVKLFLTVLYILLVVSFSKYDLLGLLGMGLYPLILFNIGDISFLDALRRLRIVLPVVCIVGIFNPFFDREIILRIGTLSVSGGVLSMLTLMLKAIFTVLASYLLIVTTSIEEICYALSLLHVPQIFVVEVLLIYRYITVLLKEARRVTQAYELRAPGQKGIAFRAWGPLLGQMLLRSMDRAGRLYQSMCLRGFHGVFHVRSGHRFRRGDLLYLLLWAGAFLILRRYPVFRLVGGLFVHLGF